MSKALLDQIADHLKAEQPRPLLALREHEDKAVRKAARKALHTLRARGIEVPEGEQRTWHAEDVSKSLRGAVEEGAVLDMFSTPGVARIMWAKPGEERGGMLVLGAIAPNGAYLDFAVYGQTDGQRRKMFRDWDAQFSGRRIPVQWAKARLRWARERTKALGFSPPRGVDDMLVELGDVGDGRPESFIGEALGDAKASEDSFTDLLMRAGAVRWPLLFDGNAIFKDLEARAKGRDPESMDADARKKELAEVAADDAHFEKALKAEVADLFEDVAVGLWQADKPADAKRFLNAAEAFRKDKKPQALPEAVEFLSAQITGVVLRQQSSMQPQVG